MSQVTAAKSMSSEHGANAVVWTVLLTAGLVWGAWTLAHTERKSETVQWAAWADGSAGVALNKSLRLPWQSELQTGSAEVRYRFMGDTGTQVALGCPQWMFYRDGLRPPPGTPHDVFQARTELLRHVVARLKDAGVGVLMVAVPDKSRIEDEHLCGLSVAPIMKQRLDDWQQFLQKQGVAHVDLRTAFKTHSEPLFFRTDVHMNALGAETAASAVAQAALALLGAKGGQVFQKSGAGAIHELEGDLLALSGLKDAKSGWRPERDKVSTELIEPVRGGGLLDEVPAVEVMLAGSSNGLRSNFAPQLGAALGREVWNLSMDGGQFSGALMKALKQMPSWPKSLKLVIWEFSENTLSLPLTEEEKDALQALKVVRSPA